MTSEVQRECILILFYMLQVYLQPAVCNSENFDYCIPLWILQSCQTISCEFNLSGLIHWSIHARGIACMCCQILWPHGPFIRWYFIAVEEPCTESEYQCEFGTQSGGYYEIPCVPEEYVCDDVMDCFFGTDENCTGMQHHNIQTSTVHSALACIVLPQI